MKATTGHFLSSSAAEIHLKKTLGVDYHVDGFAFFWAHISKEDSYRWVCMRRDDINGTSAQRQHSAVWEGNGALNGLRCCGWCEEDNKVIMGRLRIDIQLGEGVWRNERLRGGTWRRRMRGDLLESPSWLWLLWWYSAAIWRSGTFPLN